MGWGMVRKSSDSLRATLAENIKAFRKQRQLSQEELAARCGLHRTYIGSVERLERNVTLSTLEVLADTLGVSVPDLLTHATSAPCGTAWQHLTDSQRRLIEANIQAFSAPRTFWRKPDSDLITETVLVRLGDRLQAHHATSRQALSKDRFEFALEAALNDAGIPAQLVSSRTHRGHDLSIANTPVSLKTEAAAHIREDIIHVSKWMELGKGEWQLANLRDLFLAHLAGYERIFTLRCLAANSADIHYELVEIPKALLLEASGCELEIREDSRQNPKPGYGTVRDTEGQVKYTLYFAGGSERKLQIKQLRKDLCIVHATWHFLSPSL